MIIDYNSEKTTLLNLFIDRKWEYLSLFRVFLSHYFSVLTKDQRIISSMTVTATELIDNAIRYSSKEGIEIRLILDKSIDSYIIYIYNFIEPDEVEPLVNYIDEVNNTPDKFLFYVNKMKESRKRTDGKAGLGLARIAYEAKAKLETLYEENELLKDVIRVAAFIRISDH